MRILVKKIELKSQNRHIFHRKRIEYEPRQLPVMIRENLIKRKGTNWCSVSYQITNFDKIVVSNILMGAEIT